MARLSLAEAGGPNVLAFLDAIAFSEGTAGKGDDGYNVLVGGSLFEGYADHPRKLVDLPVYAIKSTAAGRYQFLARTWDVLAKRLTLDDFSPMNQDRAAIDLLRERGALPHIRGGSIIKACEIAAAIQLEAPVWASLPGAGYGQREVKMMDWLRAFGAALAHYEGLPAALGV